MRDDGFEKLLDFLKGNTENANIICSFIDDLTPEGFEHYISEYYKTVHNFTTAVNGGFNDKGIDVKGLRINENGEREHLIVQCKKWNWGPKGQRDKYFIGENLIAQFYGKVADKRHEWNIRLVYATTKDVTLGGKKFCEEKNIELLTYKELVDVNKEMNLNEWIETILTSPIPKEKKEKFITKEYIERRRLFLQKKQEIIEIARQEALREKDRYANFDRAKVSIVHISSDIDEASHIPIKKGYLTILINLIIVGFFGYVLVLALILVGHLILMIFGASNNRSIEFPKNPTQSTEIKSTQNSNQNIIPNKKRNIQKVMHTLVPISR